MKSTRVHLNAHLERGIELELPSSAVHHILRVLRMRSGDEITVFNGYSDNEFKAIITTAQRNSATIEVISSEIVARESNLKITLVQAISSGDRMDFTIQKSIELGVSEILPIYSSRSAPRFKAGRLNKRMQHWTQVMISATEQSGRTRLARLRTPQPMEDLITKPAKTIARFILDPSASLRLSEQDIDSKEVEIWIGSEGGFSEQEIYRAESAKIQPVKFGPRILRTETAGIAAITALQSKFGDI